MSQALAVLLPKHNYMRTYGPDGKEIVAPAADPAT